MNNWLYWLLACLKPFFCAANTALIYHHGKLMALSEVDKPCKFSTHYGILFYGHVLMPCCKGQQY